MVGKEEGRVILEREERGDSWKGKVGAMNEKGGIG
jgi:hypothetical protein